MPANRAAWEEAPSCSLPVNWIANSDVSVTV